MSNIINDIHRQAIAKSIVETIHPNSYAECGCYAGDSMAYWVSLLGEHTVIAGCDAETAEVDGLVKDPVAVCRYRVPRASIELADSVEWLARLVVPEPVVFYLDTDWSEKIVKDKELEVVFSKFKSFVVVANNVNTEDHPLFGHKFKPWSVNKIFELFGARSEQFIVPIYKHPALQAGYVILARGVPNIPFDPSLFSDMKVN